jgi:multicomponent Na+:H+ antiporter subunit D
MSTLAPLAVALPLLAAAAITAGGHFVPSRLANVAAGAVAAAVTVLCTILLVHTRTADTIHWFSGWHPRHGVAIGIAFTVDPLGAGLAAFAGLLMTAALVFSWGYFEETAHLFYSVMLVFLAGLTGFALTGDLFNLFVFFELMSVSAYALTGYRITQPGVLQGALNFAVTNTIGAFMVALGIALVYGRTGALNMAQAGASLAGKRADGLVIAALVLFTVGFLIKAGAVPFHFWLSDAYAVAPAPVGVMLTGVMSDLGLHAVARVYADVFSGAGFGHPGAVRGLLVAVGLASALVGGAMAFLQADLKRLLAFLTVSHGGIFLVGVGLLTPRGLAGATLDVVADGAIKAAFFLAVAVAVIKLGSSDEILLHGRGRRREHAALGVLFVVCGLGLAALPPFGPFLSKALIDQSARAAGYGFAVPLVTLATVLTGAAVLRAAGRIFLGLGPRRERLLAEQPDEPEEGEPEEEKSPRSSVVMIGPALALVVVGLGIAFVPEIGPHAIQQAARFQDRASYAHEVLFAQPLPPLPKVPAVRYSGADWLWGAVSVGGALLLAGSVLLRRQLPRAVRDGAEALFGAPAKTLHALHSGAIGDYASWISAGAALFSVVWGLLLR